MALLIAMRVDPAKIRETMQNLDFGQFRDRPFLPIMHAYNLIFRSGVYSGAKFETWVKLQIGQATGNENITFEDLHNLTKIELVIIGTSLTTSNVKYFSHRTTPNMPVWMACRISISIPFFFTPVQYDGHTYADGGILYNYPIWVFDNPRTYEYDSSKIDFLSERTLGFKLVSTGNCDFVSTIPGAIPIVRIALMLFNTFLKFIDSSYVNSAYWDRTIGINTEDITTTEFAITDDRKNRIIQNGYDNCRQYLTNKIESLKY